MKKGKLGNWCVEIRDSLSFSLIIDVDSGVCRLRYSSILYGGSIINSESNNKDYAAKFLLKDFGSGNEFSTKIKNYYTDSTYELMLRINLTDSSINWKIPLPLDVMYLPRDIEIPKCHSESN